MEISLTEKVPDCDVYDGLVWVPFPVWERDYARLSQIETEPSSVIASRVR